MHCTSQNCVASLKTIPQKRINTSCENADLSFTGQLH